MDGTGNQVEQELVVPFDALVIHTFTSTASNQLSIEKGDIIRILEMHPSKWWKASCRGKIGWVPKTFVSPVRNFNNTTRSELKYNKNGGFFEKDNIINKANKTSRSEILQNNLNGSNINSSGSSLALTPNNGIYKNPNPSKKKEGVLFPYQQNLVSNSLVTNGSKYSAKYHINNWDTGLNNDFPSNGKSTLENTFSAANLSPSRKHDKKEWKYETINTKSNNNINYNKKSIDSTFRISDFGVVGGFKNGKGYNESLVSTGIYSSGDQKAQKKNIFGKLKGRTKNTPKEIEKTPKITIENLTIDEIPASIGTECPFIINECKHYFKTHLHELYLEGVFRIPGDEVQITAALRNYDNFCSDNVFKSITKVPNSHIIEEVKGITIFSVCNILTRWLGKLSDSIIPPRYYEEFVEISRTLKSDPKFDPKEHMKKILDNLSAKSMCAYDNLLSIFNDVHVRSSKSVMTENNLEIVSEGNRMPAANIALLMSRLIIKPPPGLAVSHGTDPFAILSMEQKMVQEVSPLLEYLIINHNKQKPTITKLQNSLNPRTMALQAHTELNGQAQQTLLTQNEQRSKSKSRGRIKKSKFNVNIDDRNANEGKEDLFRKTYPSIKNLIEKEEINDNKGINGDKFNKGHKRVHSSISVVSNKQLSSIIEPSSSLNKSGNKNNIRSVTPLPQIPEHRTTFKDINNQGNISKDYERNPQVENNDISNDKTLLNTIENDVRNDNKEGKIPIGTEVKVESISIVTPTEENRIIQTPEDRTVEKKENRDDGKEAQYPKEAIMSKVNSELHQTNQPQNAVSAQNKNTNLKEYPNINTEARGTGEHQDGKPQQHHHNQQCTKLVVQVPNLEAVSGYSYEPNSPKEIPLLKNEHVVVISKSANGWSKVIKKLPTGKAIRGWVPTNYLKPVSKSDATKESPF